MILFQSDWLRFPRAIPDVKTNNTSFIEMADKYRQMGIKNYYFHLALLQPELQGIDPFDPDLPMDVLAKIRLEARYNPWYFFREIFCLPSQGSSEPDRLRANRANLGVFWLYYNHIDTGVTHPRQTGKSVGADGVNTHVIQVAGRSATFSLITKDHELRSKNIQRLKDMRDFLPPYLNPYQPRVDTNNPFGISVEEHSNKVITGVAQSSEAAALNLGRGNTSESNQVDEGPFCKNINITIPAFLSSANTARENAARHGSFYGNIFTTTAGKLDTKEGEYMYSLLMGGMMYDEHKLLDLKNQDELHRVIEKAAKGKPLVYVNMSHRQLGYSDEWLYKKMLESDSQGDAADRDYMGIWTTGSLKSPLTPRAINALKKGECDPTHVELTNQCYLINWYIPEDQIATRMASGKFVLGNDSSEVVGSDATTFYLVDSQTLETIFTVEVNESNVYSLIDWFVDSIMKKYENIVVIPERKNMGVVLIDTLIVKLIAANINPFKRIYNIIVEDGLHETEEEYRFIHREPYSWSSEVPTKYKTKFGYGTAGNGRHKRDNLYIETLTRAVDLSANVAKDKTLVKQLSELVVKNGRIDHPVKGHDDMVVAYLLSLWFLLHSKNLDFYGIVAPASRAKSLTARAEEDSAPKGWAKVTYDQNQETSRRINSLLELMDKEEDPAKLDSYESQIRILSRRVVGDQYQSNTIDEFIKNARASRERRILDRFENPY